MSEDVDAIQRRIQKHADGLLAAIEDLMASDAHDHAAVGEWLQDRGNDVVLMLAFDLLNGERTGDDPDAKLENAELYHDALEQLQELGEEELRESWYVYGLNVFEEELEDENDGRD